MAIGDFEGHVGLGVKCAKEVATAIRGAIILAKLSVVPVRRGYWGARLGEPHTVPCKVQGKVGSVSVGLVPAPRGTGIVAAPASKRMLQLAGVEDCYTQSRGNTSTMGNFIKATYSAITATYGFLYVISFSCLHPHAIDTDATMQDPRALAMDPAATDPLRGVLVALADVEQAQVLETGSACNVFRSVLPSP